MLKYTYALLMVISFVNCQAQTNRHAESSKRAFAKNEIDSQYRKNWQTNRLKGRIKTIIAFTYNGPATDTTTPDFDTKEYLRYDTRGNLTEQIKENESGAVSRQRYTYNADNMWTVMSSDDSYNSFENYHVFDSNNNLIEEGERYADGTTSNKVVSEYDQYGGRTKMIVTGLVTQFINSYDKDGLLIVQKSLVNKQLAGTTTLKYDGVGHVIEKEEYAVDGAVLSKVSTSFNTFSLPDSMAIIKKGYRDNIHVFGYDAMGHQISQGAKDPATNIWQTEWTFEYEFDHMGNWTKCIAYDASHDVAITTIRKIIYY